MIANMRSRLVPPPKPSKKSASPSSCRQPVISNRVIMAHKIATDGGRIKEVAYNTNTDKPAVSQPTNAQWLTIFLKQAAGTSANRQNGNRVKNINAASIRNISEIFSD